MTGIRSVPPRWRVAERTGRDVRTVLVAPPPVERYSSHFAAARYRGARAARVGRRAPSASAGPSSSCRPVANVRAPALVIHDGRTRRAVQVRLALARSERRACRHAWLRHAGSCAPSRAGRDRLRRGPCRVCAAARARRNPAAPARAALNPPEPTSMKRNRPSRTPARARRRSRLLRPASCWRGWRSPPRYRDRDFLSVSRSPTVTSPTCSIRACAFVNRPGAARRLAQGRRRRPRRSEEAMMPTAASATRSTSIASARRPA